MKDKTGRKELIQQYKEINIEAGVYQIKNTVNQKVFIDVTPNLKSLNGRLMMLQMGTHHNKLLQSEWNQYGVQAFVMEPLEVLKPIENQFVEIKDELKKLKEIWVEKLQPYGESGYHVMK